MHSAAPSAAKLQTQINLFFSVSPHLTADPISSACARTHPASIHQRGALILRAVTRPLPPSRSGVTDTGRWSRRREEGGERGKHTGCIQEPGQRTTNERQDGEEGRGGGNIYHSSVHEMEEVGSFILRRSMHWEENGEGLGYGQSINS